MRLNSVPLLFAASLPTAVLSAGCLSTTTGARSVTSVTSAGDPEITALASLGAGYAFDTESAVNLSIDMGSSTESPLLLGETLSYSNYGQGLSVRSGLSFQAGLVGEEAVHATLFGQYAHVLKRSRGRSGSLGGGKGGLGLSQRRSSYWALSFGPELGVVSHAGDTQVALGLGLRLGWDTMTIMR